MSDDLRAENERLRQEVEFGIAKVLAMSNQLSEQAAVHHKREVLLKIATEHAAKHLANLKIVGRRLDDIRAERDALYAVAGDLWNFLENCRDYWSTLPFGPMVEDCIAEYERLAGISGEASS